MPYTPDCRSAFKLRDAVDVDRLSASVRGPDLSAILDTGRAQASCLTARATSREALFAELTESAFEGGLYGKVLSHAF
jgi:hypothetical protein